MSQTESILIGETGSAFFKNGGIYAKQEENSRELYCRTVTEALIELAKRDAQVFAEEFPGETLDGSDWDSEAWAVAAGELSSEIKDELATLNPGTDDGLDLGWECYAHHLRAEIKKLADRAAA